VLLISERDQPPGMSFQTYVKRRGSQIDIPALSELPNAGKVKQKRAPSLVPIAPALGEGKSYAAASKTEFNCES
jgi:hypothetical protein